MILDKNIERPFISFDWALKHLLRNKENVDIVEIFSTELLKQPIRIYRIYNKLKNNRFTKDSFSFKRLLKMCEILDYNLLSPEEKADYDNYQNIRKHISDTIISNKRKTNCKL